MTFLLSGDGENFVWKFKIIIFYPHECHVTAYFINFCLSFLFCHCISASLKNYIFFLSFRSLLYKGKVFFSHISDFLSVILRILLFVFHADVSKELSFHHKLLFSNHYIFGTRCCRHLIFQTMNYVRSNNHSLKYQRLTSLGRRNIGIRLFQFVAKTQVLSLNSKLYLVKVFFY